MNKKSFKLSNGETLDVGIFTGEVLDSNKTRHTTVHQGKAAVGANVVVPGQVYSEVHTEHEVWLRDADGKERAIDFGELRVPVRTGHQVTVFYAGPATAETWRIAMIKNDTTGSWDTKPDLCKSLGANDATYLKDFFRVIGIPPVLFFAILAVGSLPWPKAATDWLVGAAFLIPIAYFLYKINNIINRKMKVEQELEALMRSLVQA
uniref:Uncharacterized protein n=1 Tax=Curvibacter symbiont subsp. Hydra magnipapillata TaxID=667019 RepID=C9Y728_CURXX|nr:hypothetical protein Csp_H40110 [Curvibacter putative symbiont of Hydra magnipapillata]